MVILLATLGMILEVKGGILQFHINKYELSCCESPYPTVVKLLKTNGENAYLYL